MSRHLPDLMDQVTDWPWPTAPLWASLAIAAAVTLTAALVGILVATRSLWGGAR